MCVCPLSTLSPLLHTERLPVGFQKRNIMLCRTKPNEEVGEEAMLFNKGRIPAMKVAEMP
jgi:hypothetical protein